MRIDKIVLIILPLAFMVMATATATAIILGGESEKGKKMNHIEKTLEKNGVYAVIETGKGSVILELYYKETPLTVCNFVGLAEGTLKAAKGKPFYNGLLFHRVISNFMVQGGDPEGRGSGGPGYQFPDEIVPTLKHDAAGVLSMANAGPGTNGSQFFITHVPTPWLDGKHTVFGRVVKGQDVVNKISQGDRIVSISIIRKGEDAHQFTATDENFTHYLSEASKKVNRAAAEKTAAAEAIIKEKYPNAKKTDSGIYYTVVKNGNGIKVQAGNTITMKYKGSLLDGTVFDNSDMHRPLTFTAGAGKLIPGFDSQALEMSVGEKRIIVIPPELAYGARGAGGLIPPNAHLIFELELLSAK